jgi:cytochrome c biogenesis protein CcmG, thiol:disulfide interchange protein DsbE
MNQPIARRFRVIAVLPVVAALALFALGCQTADEVTPEPEPDVGANHPAVGTPLQVVRLQPLTGDPKPVSTADIEGKVTLINFWGPWCGFCEIEFPHLVEMVDHFEKNPDFKFLSVSSPAKADEADTLHDETVDFLKRLKADFPTYRDDDYVTTKQLLDLPGVGERGFGYPATVVLDRDGKIAALWIGYVPGWEKQMRRVVQAELDKTAEVASGQ